MAGYFTTQENGYYLKDRQEARGLVCKKCVGGKVTTGDGRGCIGCQTGLDSTGTRCLPCPRGHIRVERSLDGIILGTVQCVKCAPGSAPDPAGVICQPCANYPLVTTQDNTHSLNTKPDCSCNLRAGLCLPDNLELGDLYTESVRAYQILYRGEEKDSSYLREHMTVAAYMCGKHLNMTACNQLANMCTLTLHTRDHPACRTIITLTRLNNDLNTRRVPRIFFPQGQSSGTLESESILSSHSLAGRGDRYHSRLNMTVARYAMDGTFLGAELAGGNMFQLCNISSLVADAAWQFGTRYEQSCRIRARELWSQPTIFYDLFVPYRKGDETMMYMVPNRIVTDDSSKDDKDDKNWVLTSRFFLVDTTGGISGASPEPKIVRYLESMEVRVRLLNTRESPDKPGRIHPPLVVLRYKDILVEEADDGAEVEMKFSVTYEMEMKESKKDVEIAVGVLSVFAVLLAAIEAWSWSRRSGKVAVDLSSLVKMLFSAAGYLSYVFLCVIFFTCLYWFVFFKQQTFVHAVLPTRKQEQFIKHYLISAFVLKTINIGYLLYSQISVDVFLLDWERPPLISSKEKEAGEPPISVWRTYLVANEWNELQIRRKTRIGLQLVMVVFIMKILGVENLCSADPHNLLKVEEGKYMATPSYVCRLGLGVAIWLGLALIQSVFWVGIYTGAVEDKLAQFTDVCSLSNISVFIMSHSHFGYYIHGKSAHGTADTNMAGLMDQLQREADDLCGHRGLQAGSDHQTFSMTLPHKLRSYYDKVVTPASQANATTKTRLTGTVLENMVHAYTTMNRFLTRFLEHALRDLDYEVRDKMFLETVLDIEFQDAVAGDKAVFYTDNGHSFDSVLLYGNEFSLTIFEVLVFAFTDLFASDFLISALVTYLVSKAMSVVRYTAGRANLATKTLIDRRFLI